jgi:hypothetical protein
VLSSSQCTSLASGECYQERKNGMYEDTIEGLAEWRDFVLWGEALTPEELERFEAWKKYHSIKEVTDCHGSARKTLYCEGVEACHTRIASYRVEVDSPCEAVKGVSHWIGYLTYGEDDSLSDQDIADIKRWLEFNGIAEVCGTTRASEGTYFSWGLREELGASYDGADCVDYVCKLA